MWQVLDLGLETQVLDLVLVDQVLGLGLGLEVWLKSLILALTSGSVLERILVISLHLCNIYYGESVESCVANMHSTRYTGPRKSISTLMSSCASAKDFTCFCSLSATLNIHTNYAQHKPVVTTYNKLNLADAPSRLMFPTLLSANWHRMLRNNDQRNTFRTEFNNVCLQSRVCDLITL